MQQRRLRTRWRTEMTEQTQRHPDGPLRRCAAPSQLAAAASGLASAVAAANPLDNPASIENPTLSGSQKLSFAYFQRCVFPVFLAQLPIQLANGSRDQHLRGVGLPRQHQRHRRRISCHSATRSRSTSPIRPTQPTSSAPATCTRTSIRRRARWCSARRCESRAAHQADGQRRAARRRLRLRDAQTTRTRKLIAVLDQPPGAGRARRVQPIREQPVHAGRPEHRHVQHANELLLAGAGPWGCRELATSPPASPGDRRCSPPTGRRPRRTAEGPSASRVADPYLELHTGPGRGFPVFFVAARDEWIDIELRSHRLVQGAHRRRQGRLGAPRPARDHPHRQPACRRPFATSLVDDYLSAASLQIGAAWGQFK